MREVPLVPQAVAALREQRAALAHRNGGAVPATGWIFPTTTGRPPRAGAPDLPLHSLRHTTASLLLSAGVPAEQAAKILGHKSLVVFYHTYADLLRPGAQDAAAKLARYLAAQEQAPPKTSPCLQTCLRRRSAGAESLLALSTAVRDARSSTSRRGIRSQRHTASGRCGPEP